MTQAPFVEGKTQASVSQSAGRWPAGFLWLSTAGGPGGMRCRLRLPPLDAAPDEKTCPAVVFPLCWCGVALQEGFFALGLTGTLP